MYLVDINVHEIWDLKYQRHRIKYHMFLSLICWTTSVSDGCYCSETMVNRAQINIYRMFLLTQ